MTDTLLILLKSLNFLFSFVMKCLATILIHIFSQNVDSILLGANSHSENMSHAIGNGATEKGLAISQETRREIFIFFLFL